MMQRLRVVDLLGCPLNTFAPRLASVSQPRQGATLQDVQELRLFLQMPNTKCQNLQRKSESITLIRKLPSVCPTRS